MHPSRRRSARGGTTWPAAMPCREPRRSYPSAAPPSTRASTSTAGADLLDPGRPDEHARARGRPATPVEVEVAPRRSRPGGRRRCAAPSCRSRRTSAWSARAVQRSGRRAGSSRRRSRRPAGPPRSAARSGSSSSKIRASLSIVVDSPAGQHEAVEAVELGRPADRRAARRTRSSAREVLAHVALQGEDADAGQSRRRAQLPPAAFGEPVRLRDRRRR